MATKKQLDQIIQWQKERQNDFKSVPKEGKKISYLGKQFIVYKNVFWPFNDSIPLVENLKINKGESVLDIGTGSGVIAVFAAYKGAGKVVAIDINPAAVKAAKDNAKLHGFSEIIDVRVSDMFESVRENEKFDVITGNLPFRDKEAPDLVAASHWDTDLQTHKKFFADVNEHLKPNGRIYLAQSIYGAVDEMKKMAQSAGFQVNLIGKKEISSEIPRTFYAFELTRS